MLSPHPLLTPTLTSAPGLCADPQQGRVKGEGEGTRAGEGIRKVWERGGEERQKEGQGKRDRRRDRQSEKEGKRSASGRLPRAGSLGQGDANSKLGSLKLPFLGVTNGQRR